MVYSLNRAVPMGIIGFITGAGLVILLRGLQQMDQLWNPQLGLIVGGVFAAVAFLWGIGGLSSAMANHVVVEPEEDEFGNELAVEDHHHHVDDKPVSILNEQIWTIAFWTAVLFVAILIFAALPGGFGYTISNDAAANTNANGFFPINLGGGNTVYVSKLAAFIVFTAVTIISLWIAAYLMAIGFFALNRGLKTTKAVGNQPLQSIYAPLGAGSAVAALTSGQPAEAATPPVPLEPERKRGLIGGLIHFIISMLLDEPTAASRRSTGQRARRLLVLLLTAIVLYFVFYEVAIGFIIPQKETMTVLGLVFAPYVFRIIMSLANAVLITLLVLRTKWILYSIGRIARFSAWVMRGIPAFLFQRD